MEKPVFRTRKSGFVLVLIAVVQPAFAQVGYISVHVKALNEESSPLFTYTISGGNSFTLSDLPSSQRCSDLGGSHDGGLWVVAEGALRYRKPGGTGWVSTGDSATAVDGAGPGECVYTTPKGLVVAYREDTRDTLYIPSAHGGHKAVDVANNASLQAGQGETVVVDDQGHLLIYTGYYERKSDHWMSASTSNTSLPAGILHVDVNITNRNILFSTSEGRIYQATPQGEVTALGTALGTLPTNMDVAYDDEGGMYCIARNTATGGADGVCAWNGHSWQGDSSSRNVEHLTGGAGNEVWGIDGLPTDANDVATIFTRSTDGGHFWYDNEWINSNNGNSVLIPVAPGTYTITGTSVPNWSCQAITLHDPAGTSTASVATNSATLTVAAGEVVTADFQNGLVQPSNISQVCHYTILQDFGTGSATYGPPLKGLTDYHYLAVNFPLDGYYTLAHKTGSAWGNPNLVDHTTGTGYFMLINASYGKDEFFRERVTGLVPGMKYTLSAYIADISPQAPIRPNVLFGITDATTGVLLGSLSTGDIHNTAWQQFSFTFEATTTTADIFINNNNIGGAGNDLALDDIAFSPIPNVVASIRNLSSDTACLGSPLALTDTTASGVWSSLAPGTATVDDAGHVTSLTPGQVWIRYSVTNQIGCTSADSIRLTFLPHTTAGDITVSAPSVCTGHEAVLRASSTVIKSPRFGWFSDSALTHLLDTGEKMMTPVLMATTPYFVSATGVGYCPSLPDQGAKAVAVVNPYPVVAGLGGSTQVCAGAGTTLSDVTPGGHWTIVPDTIARIDSGGKVTGTQAGQAQVIYTVTTAGCTTQVTMPVAILPLPTIDPINGAHPVCQGDTLRVTDGIPGGTWSGQVDGNGLVATASAGTHTITYTINGQNGCTAQTTTVVDVQAAPPVPDLQSPQPASVCGGRTLAISAAPGTAAAYRWYLDGNVLAGDTAGTLSATQPGVYTVQALSSAGCASGATPALLVTARCEIDPVADLSVTVTANPGPFSVQSTVTYTVTVVNHGPAQAQNVVVSDTLSPNVGDPGNYSGATPYFDPAGRTLSWQMPLMAPMDSAVLTFDVPMEVLNNTVNTAVVSATTPDPNIANNVSTYTIWQESGLFIPNAVSPNGDGKNDRFLIVGLDKYPNSQLTVFNRWGNQVYHSDNYANDWDGHELSDGTYYYILLLNTIHGKQAYKGWIEILHK
ncbi:T9SS type B sorting domain-containing protein [Dinghuibacter silviterrae]|uniref:Putative repeat protein (TIGR01451 family)/gliding motility-associated-like protein n=1 Tax=Dinghuibacter silviterrae TaxID=1539049 RepID=A0A4R8DWJ9_9BACT|nr:gliding motility-associated C-terminal domain-containing protein [Dinghuibacter silviterrae]TDX01797.1 putative repeat protein (TIGR01451 family)/gliding motility-associated-like protein [Dinghuibacter silviterrae]